jgi:hypothetical protein
VPESEPFTSRAAQGGAPRSGADDLLPEITARATPEREGLPRSYRMRADAHYVDQLETPAQPVVRLIAVGQIDCRDLPASDRVVTLTKSIGVHGVLQPLRVRKQGTRYSVIAGRKRLAAAIAAGLAAVPCTLHDVEGSAAAALAAADNLRIEEPPTFALSATAGKARPAAGEHDAIRPMLAAIVSDLTAIRTSTSLLRTMPMAGLSQRVGADLIESQAIRAGWLVGCMLGTFENNRQVPLAAILQRVADGFEAQATLMGLQLDWSTTPAAAVWKLPEDSAAAVITGAIFATIGCLDGVVRPLVEIHADATLPRALKIEVVQRAVRMPAALEDDLITRDSGRAGELAPAVALRMARTIAAAQGATLEVTALPGNGSVLQITFAGVQTVA